MVRWRTRSSNSGSTKQHGDTKRTGWRYLFTPGGGGICASSHATLAVNHRFLAPAEDDLLEAARLYEDQAIGLGERFLDEVERCLELLLDRPHIGRPIGKLRRFPLRKFPFTLIYALDDDGLVVVAVALHRRRPGYWRERQCALSGSADIPLRRM